MAHYNIKWLTERFESGDTLKYIFFWGAVLAKAK